MSQNALFILNPKAGKQKILRYLPEILQIFAEHDIKLTVKETAQSGDGIRFAEQYTPEYDFVIASGGDGSLNEVITGLRHADAHCPIGYIPAGSTNDFAAGLYLPTDLVESAREIALGSPHSFDLGQFNDRYFSYVACAGAFAKTSYGTSQRIKNRFGHLAYVIGGILDLPTFRSSDMRITAGGETYEGRYIYCGISNATHLGGVFQLKPELVDLDDGLFEIMLVKSPKGLFSFLKLAFALFGGNPAKSSLVTLIHAKSADIDCDTPLGWSLDGEYFEGVPHIHMENIAHGLQLLKR